VTQFTTSTRRWALLGSRRSAPVDVEPAAEPGPEPSATFPSVPRPPAPSVAPTSEPSRVSGVRLSAAKPPSAGKADAAAKADVATVYDAYAPFMWRSLQRMGVPDGDLEDAMQEVFIVVHRKLDSYQEDKAKLSTWLFGIGVNIARRHRAKVRNWHVGLDPDLTRSEAPSQEAELQRKQESSLLQALLGRMRPEHSATFVMFELEGLSCTEIADLTGVPVGTVYSRLHKAREQFQLLAQKHTSKSPLSVGSAQ
jgi:RNA polymerase sigma-70 factor, ECF subfamily